jgi:hypothetical protein
VNGVVETMMLQGESSLSQVSDLAVSISQFPLCEDSRQMPANITE